MKKIENEKKWEGLDRVRKKKGWEPNEETEGQVIICHGRGGVGKVLGGFGGSHGIGGTKEDK